MYNLPLSFAEKEFLFQQMVDRKDFYDRIIKRAYKENKNDVAEKFIMQRDKVDVIMSKLLNLGRW